MIKLILGIILLVIFPLFVTESFSYFNGDMHNHNFEYQNETFEINNSKIIKFNHDFSNEQQHKRYLIFGKGSISEIGTFNIVANSFLISAEVYCLMFCCINCNFF